MPETAFETFARFLGWQPNVMTQDLSPNVTIENPQTFVEFLHERYGGPIRVDVARFRAAQAEADANAARNAIDVGLASELEAQRQAAAQIVTFAAEEV